MTTRRPSRQGTTGLLSAPLLLLTLVGCGASNADSGQPAKTDKDTVVLQDREPYYRGSYQAFASPWSSYLDKSLVHKVDYEDVITVRPSTFPNGTVFDTRWPTSQPTKSGVWGYHALSFGNYDGGRPPKFVKPKRVESIRRLNQQFSYRYSGSRYFNLLTEFYLTSREGDENAKVIEVGFFLHTPRTTVGFAEDGKFIGQFRDRTGRIWTVHMQDKFCMIIPKDREDVLQGTIEMKPVLDFLIRKGLLTGKEWFNGIAFGLEPSPGGGSTKLSVDHWSVQYQ